MKVDNICKVGRAGMVSSSQQERTEAHRDDQSDLEVCASSAIVLRCSRGNLSISGDGGEM